MRTRRVKMGALCTSGSRRKSKSAVEMNRSNTRNGSRKKTGPMKSYRPETQNVEIELYKLPDIEQGIQRRVHGNSQNELLRNKCTPDQLNMPQTFAIIPGDIEPSRCGTTSNQNVETTYREEFENGPRKTSTTLYKQKKLVSDHMELDEGVKNISQREKQEKIERFNQTAAKKTHSYHVSDSSNQKLETVYREEFDRGQGKTFKKKLDPDHVELNRTGQTKMNEGNQTPYHFSGSLDYYTSEATNIQETGRTRSSSIREHQLRNNQQPSSISSNSFITRQMQPPFSPNFCSGGASLDHIANTKRDPKDCFMNQQLTYHRRTLEQDKSFTNETVSKYHLKLTTEEVPEYRPQEPDECTEMVETYRKRAAQEENYNSIELAEEVKEEQPLEIVDMHKYFRNDFDLKQLDSLDYDIRIDTVKHLAREFEEPINKFEETNYSMEYFVLDEKLMRFIEYLDKIKSEDEEIIRKKIETIEYIKHLQTLLDERASDD